MLICICRKNAEKTKTKKQAKNKHKFVIQRFDL